MTRETKGLLLVALLVCGTGDPAHAEEPVNGDVDLWRQPSITVQRPAGETQTATLPRALRCRRLFGCLPTDFSPLETNRKSKGTDHD